MFGLVAVTAILGAAEVVCQVRAFFRAQRRPSLPTQLDPYTGTHLVPGARYVRETRRASINSLGFRGPEVTLEKPPATVRVLCVGGSTTYGLYDSDDDATWPARLEASLRAAGRPAGKRVEVLNGGAPGWTLRQNLTDLERSLFRLRPDVVVCYQGYNDLMTNLDAQYQADSKVEDVALLYRPAPTRLLEHSALYRLLRSQLDDPETAFLVKKDVLDPEGAAAYARNLRRLVRRCREEGARLLLCTQPTCYRATHEASLAAHVPDLEQWFDKLFPLTYPRLIEGMRAYDDQTRAVGREAGVPVLDLAAVFPDDVSLYMSPIHHSDAGEVRVAALVEAALLEHHLLE